MASLKIKKDGVWEDISGGVPANCVNADTVDGKHASDFASVSDIDEVRALVGDDTVSSQISSAVSGKADIDHVHNEYTTAGDVSTQIDDALANFSSGKTLTEHLEEEMMVLTPLQYGDELPSPEVPGRIFFLRVT